MTGYCDGMTPDEEREFTHQRELMSKCPAAVPETELFNSYLGSCAAEACLATPGGSTCSDGDQSKLEL